MRPHPLTGHRPQVYQVYARRPPEEVHALLRALGADFVILEDSICFERRHRRGCRLRDLLDVANGHVSAGGWAPGPWDGMVSRRLHTGAGLQLAGQEPLPTGHVEGVAVKTKSKTSAFLKLLLEHQWAGPSWLWLWLWLCLLTVSLSPGACPRPRALQAKTPLYTVPDSES